MFITKKMSSGVKRSFELCSRSKSSNILLHKPLSAPSLVAIENNRFRGLIKPFNLKNKLHQAIFATQSFAVAKFWSYIEALSTGCSRKIDTDEFAHFCNRGRIEVKKGDDIKLPTSGLSYFESSLSMNVYHKEVRLHTIWC